MKKHYTLLTLSFIFLSFPLFSQQKLSANIYTGWLFPNNDLTQTDYVGYQPNLAVGAGMGYDLAPFLRLRGDLMYGSINGNDKNTYYQTNIFEPQIGFDLNLIRIFNPKFEKIKLNAQAGTGMLFYHGTLYNRNSRQKIAESPLPDQKSLSPNGFISYGLNVGIALTPKLDLNLGMLNRYVINAPWMDVTKSGDYTDMYGMASIGFTYYLKSDKDPNSIEIDKKKYNSMLADMDSLKGQNNTNEADKERIAQLEMENQEKDVRIHGLEATLDSIKNAPRVGTVPGKTASVNAPANASEVLATPAYRIIVASLPARQMADRWIERSNLDKSEMVVAYVQNLNTYRVIYKSFSTYEAARKELQNIKSTIPDAWIIKF